MAANDKKYGLFVPKKGGLKQPVLKKANVFGSDSDDEEKDSSTKMAKFPIKNECKSKLKSQIQLEIEKALSEDPSVYEYDAIYDDMQEEKKASFAKRVDKNRDKPKYVTTLLKTAELRKREHERRTERQVQKEREQEGEEFKNKESFVTGAYRAKMAAMQAEEEEERRKDQLEDMLDVRKQKDMSGFYRHLLNQTTGEEALPSVGGPPQEDVKPDFTHNSSASDTSASDSEAEQTRKVNNRRKGRRSCGDSERNSSGEERRRRESRRSGHSSHKSGKDLPDRAIKRERSSSRSVSPGKEVSDRSDRREGRTNDTRDSGSDSQELSKDKGIKVEASYDVPRDKHVGVESGTGLTAESKQSRDKHADSDRDEVKVEVKVEVDSKEAQIRKLFAKRNVGEKLEAAKQRFWQRKLAREQGEFVPQV